MSPEEALRYLMAVLDRLGMRYFIGGSLASSVHGTYRSTADIDLVAGVDATDVPRLAEALRPDFYADPEMMRDALARGRAFNVIHFQSSYKFDIFPLGDDPYSAVQLERRQMAQLETGGEPLRFPVASAEDIILHKLMWYRSGGEVSERQWNDVRGVVAVQGERLDRDYLRQWAPQLGVTELLERLLGDQSRA